MIRELSKLKVIELFFQRVIIGKVKGGIIINVANNLNNRANDIQEETEQLQNSNYKLRELNCILSHEIKAPVRAIDSYAQIFIEDYGKEIDEDGIELIKDIRHICGDTLLLINKLLEYVKLSDMEPAKEIINLEDLIQSTFDKLVNGHRNKDKIQLKFESTMPNILADSFLFRQVIINIISNSLKFTRNKESVLITVGYLSETNEDIFYIKDNGVGFDMRFSENLFGMFERMHSENEFDGSGVGLAIVRKIIQKFGGRAWIVGEVDKGACTYFTINKSNIYSY